MLQALNQDGNDVALGRDADDAAHGDFSWTVSDVNALALLADVVHGIGDEHLGQLTLPLCVLNKTFLLQARSQFVGLVRLFKVRADDAKISFCAFRVQRCTRWVV
jgi:hypothetical protein